MLIQSLRMSLSAISSNKVRSFLTMLGVIIGIMAVVVLVSIVSSSTSQVTDELATMGADKLTVSISSTRYQPYTLSELGALVEESENISMAAPTLSTNATLKSGSTSQNASVTGTTADYFEIESLAVSSGRLLKQPDVDNALDVVVIGSELAEDLFGSGGAAVGQTLSVNGRAMEVVGVLEESGSSLMGSSDSGAYIPFTTSLRISGSRGVTSFTALAANSEVIELAEAEIDAAMLDRFNDEDAYSILNQSSLAESMSSITDTLSLMLGGIAGISLLVGGIGIMNIMLVSVSERTQEIGIRKAIGASRRRILLQFLIEALVLSTLGGLIGIGASWALLAIISAALGTTYAMSSGVALLAVIFSMAIGLIFGLSPANKAAKMTPIDALRTS